MIENYCKHCYIDELLANICFIHLQRPPQIQNLPYSYLQNQRKNICSWRIGIVNTKYPKKGWFYEIEDSHYGWDFAYSINVEQDKVIPQRPSPVNTLVLHSHHLEESTPSSLEVKGWREKVIMMELIVDTLKYLRLTWWCRDCDHGIQTLLTKKGVKMTFWKNTFLTSNFKNDRKWQVLIIFSGRYCGYICIVK